MKIAEHCVVTLELELRDAEGNVVEHYDAGNPLVYLHGHTEILDGLLTRLEGLEPGSRVADRLSPDEAFGDHDPAGIVPIGREELPEGVEVVPGDVFAITFEDDGEVGELDAHVLEIRPEGIVVDLNPPLAGQTLSFEAHILEVREATPDELDGTFEAGPLHPEDDDEDEDAD